MNYLLISIGIFLIVVNLKGVFKGRFNFKSIFKNNLNDNNQKSEEYFLLRKEFSQKILELELEIEEIKNSISSKENLDFKKAREVNRLFKEGLDEEMIAWKLKISREEIALLKDL